MLVEGFIFAVKNVTVVGAGSCAHSNADGASRCGAPCESTQISVLGPCIIQIESAPKGSSD